MFDREVSMGCVMSVTCWAGALLAMLTGTILLIVAPSLDSNLAAAALAVIAHALALTAVAATVTVRQMFKQQNRLLRDAFDMGRDVASRRIGGAR